MRWLPESPDAGDPPRADIGNRSEHDLGTANGQAHILVADDNADMRDYIRRLLGLRAKR